MSALEIYEVADRAWMGPEAVGTGHRDGGERRIMAMDGPADPVLRRLQSAALLGALAWLALLPVPVDGGGMSGAVSRWSMLALLVVVPLGMALLVEARDASIGRASEDAQDPARADQRSGRDLPAGLGLLLPAAGGLASASLLMPTGPAAGILALPWIGLALGVTGHRGRQLLADALDRGDGSGRGRVMVSLGWPARLADATWWAERCAWIALLWWSVGAAWLLATRLALDLGYGALVARLTVAHFHYAGFGAAVLVVMAGRWLRQGRPGAAKAAESDSIGLRSRRRRDGVATLGLWMGTAAVALAFPLVAAGIGLGPLTEAGAAPAGGLAGSLDPSWIGRLARGLEVAGALGMGLGLLAIGALQLWWIAPSLASPFARWLMRVSGLGAAIAMPLAMGYGLRLAGLDIARMLSWHGRVNAIFFVLCGILAWTLESRRSEG